MRSAIPCINVHEAKLYALWKQSSHIKPTQDLEGVVLFFVETINDNDIQSLKKHVSVIYVKYRKVASILKQKIRFSSNFTKKLHCLSAMRCDASEFESLLAHPPAHPSNQMSCAQVFERSAWLGMVVSPCQSQHACGTRLRFAPVL